MVSTNVLNRDGGPLTTKRRRVQIINDDGDIVDTVTMQDNGRLTSTSRDTPMIPAPEDDDVNSNDWIQNFIGEVEHDDMATWDDIEASNMERHTVVSGSYDTLRNIVRKFDPPLKEEHMERGKFASIIILDLRYGTHETYSTSRARTTLHTTHWGQLGGNAGGQCTQNSRKVIARGNEINEQRNGVGCSMDARHETQYEVCA